MYAEAVKLPLVSHFKTRKRFVEYNLQTANLIELLNAYEGKNRMKSPNYTMQPVVASILLLQQQEDFIFQPDDVDEDFYSYYSNFLLTKQRPLKNSTITLYCTKIKAALGWGCKHGALVSDSFGDIPKEGYEKTKIALSQDMVSHIYHFDINTIPCRPQHKRTLERVRDMFVIMCSLGQRHSDAVRITPECFKQNGNIFTIRQKKTKEIAEVDLHKFAFDFGVLTNLLKKYNYTAPYTSNTATFDKHLHELMMYIGKEFNNVVRFENKVNGDMIAEQFNTYQLISSHVARRSFVTLNIITRGFSEVIVRRATGHKSVKCLEKYIIVSYAE